MFYVICSQDAADDVKRLFGVDLVSRYSVTVHFKFLFQVNSCA